VVVVVTQGTWMCPAFCLQMGLSILNHSLENWELYVNVVDKTLAHCLGVACALDALLLCVQQPPRGSLVLLGCFWVCLTYCSGVFHVN
jgi:hypothetical protein